MVSVVHTKIAKIMGPTWGPPGSYLPQMGPMINPWTLLSGYFLLKKPCISILPLGVIKTSKTVMPAHQHKINETCQQICKSYIYIYLYIYSNWIEDKCWILNYSDQFIINDFCSKVYLFLFHSIPKKQLPVSYVAIWHSVGWGYTQRKSPCPHLTSDLSIDFLWAIILVWLILVMLHGLELSYAKCNAYLYVCTTCQRLNIWSWVCP